MKKIALPKAKLNLVKLYYLSFLIDNKNFKQKF